MGLFGNKARTEAIKAQIAQRMEHGELLQLLVRDIHQTLLTEEYDWLGRSTGYYDSNMRSVIVTTDSVFIFNCPISQITNLDESVKQARKASALAPLSGRSMERANSCLTEVHEAANALLSKDSIGFSYTSYGFTPVPEYRTTDHQLALDRSEVLNVWAEILKQTMEQNYSRFSFTDEIQTVKLECSSQDACAFSYKVPPLKWKAWF